MKNVSVLGSTGSIGKQTLEVAAANPDKIKIRALAAHTSDDLLEEQINIFQPEFYSPNYGESKLFPPDDHRRTLYWNPDVETDEHGNVELKCYNAGNSTYLTIRAESLYNGEPITLTK